MNPKSLLILSLLACMWPARVPVNAAGIEPSPAALAQAQSAWDVAKSQLQRTLVHLRSIEPNGIYYPQVTENEALKDNAGYAHGDWKVSNIGGGTFWARGAFPGMLWLMAARESDPQVRSDLEQAARTYSEPLLGTTSSDMAMNNLFALRPWYHAAADAAERAMLADHLIDGAALLAEPFDRAARTGRFHLDIGAMGYPRKASRTDNVEYFHAFVDHSPNVEQLLWAARLVPDEPESADWAAKAVSHITVLGGTFGGNRNPGDSGTWQRGYFDWDITSPTYGAFLFNEAKQGFGDGTTWSRGQAWYVYGAAVAYAHTFDAGLLPFVKAQVDYYLAHLPDRFPGDLRRPGKMVPPWDFDYALYGNPDPGAADHGPQPDTDVDSSAGAMALAGILQLVAALPEADPDRARYLADAEAMLLELCGETYLCDSADPEMSILRHGCYHHPRSVAPSSDYDNGLIWGDYFLVHALWCYLQLSEGNVPDLQIVRTAPSAPEAGLVAHYRRPVGSLPFGYVLEVSEDLVSWERVPPMRERVTPGFDGAETVELWLDAPGAAPRFVRVVR
jgi:hypothetical protein